MAVYLVRHADARSRSNWEDDDRLRPLTKKGYHQAHGIADDLRHRGIKRLVSSPAVRCVDTLVPLAHRLKLDVEEDEALMEGSPTKSAYALLLDVAEAKGSVALCTHGDLVPELLSAATQDGLELLDPPRWSKGSTWVLESRDGRFTTATYRKPPD